MGKVFIALGVALLSFIAILVAVAILPAEWVGYISGKIISLFTDEGQHIYIKVVPSTNSYGYLYVTVLAILGVALVYYGNKLNGSKIK